MPDGVSVRTLTGPPDPQNLLGLALDETIKHKKCFFAPHKMIFWAIYSATARFGGSLGLALLVWQSISHVGAVRPPTCHATFADLMLPLHLQLPLLELVVTVSHLGFLTGSV